MALSQDDRIAISKKIIDIPKQNAQADNIQAQLDPAKAKAEKEDLSNKSLMDDITPLVNAYQTELQRYDGNGRTQLLEQDLQDSVDKVLQNPFFPNDPNTPLPSVPDGVWKNFTSFSGNKAIGKTYLETFTSVTREQDLIDAVTAAIAVVEGFVDATRSSGDECNEGGSCSMPQYDNETDCTNNGGTWTPGPDIISPSAAMSAAGTDLINAIAAWETFLNGTDAVIPDNVTDPDATRQTQNTAAKDDIANAISIIDTWQALQDYDTTTSTPSDCPSFNSFAASNFDPSKFRATELAPIQSEITARQTFITSRISQLLSDTYLGGVTQDLNSGEITAATGFYGRRFRIIETRLNLMGGSLSKLKGFDSAQKAQDELKNSNANAELAYGSILVASAFRAPSVGTGTIHVLDGSGFSPGDSVFVVADDQDEISATINSINGNTIFLDTLIPKKYRQDAGARLYKVL